MDAEALLRRYLEQRREMDERDLVLDGLGVDEVLRIVGAARETSRAAGSTGGELAPGRPRAAPGARAAADAVPEASGMPAPGATREPGAAREPGVLPPDAMISAAASLEEIATLVGGCTRCPLFATATHGVPGAGNTRAGLMCVGEAPGAAEDETGQPFVGAAGQLLTKILAAVNLQREDVFIGNVLKHRPPGNRNPAPAEVEACRPYLERQIELVGPRVLVALGTFAAQTLLETKLSIGKLRGTVHHYRSIPVVVTYHPAALLRNPAWKRPTWDDIQLARRLLDSATP